MHTTRVAHAGGAGGTEILGTPQWSPCLGRRRHWCRMSQNQVFLCSVTILLPDEQWNCGEASHRHPLWLQVVSDRIPGQEGEMLRQALTPQALTPRGQLWGSRSSQRPRDLRQGQQRWHQRGQGLAAAPEGWVDLVAGSTGDTGVGVTSAPAPLR